MRIFYILLAVLLINTINSFSQSDSVKTNFTISTFLTGNSYPVKITSEPIKNYSFIDYYDLPWKNKELGLNFSHKLKKYGYLNYGLIYRMHYLNLVTFEERTTKIFPNFEIIKNDFNNINYLTVQFGYSYPLKIGKFLIEPIISLTISTFNEIKNNSQSLLLKEKGQNNYMTFNYRQLDGSGFMNFYPSMKMTYNFTKSFGFFMLVEYFNININSEYQVIKTETSKEPEYYYFNITDRTKCFTFNFGFNVYLNLRKL